MYSGKEVKAISTDIGNMSGFHPTYAATCRLDARRRCPHNYARATISVAQSWQSYHPVNRGSDMNGFEAFAEVKRAIVVAAHPDDLECCCGGVVSMLVARGVEVFSANCTLGDIGAQDAQAGVGQPKRLRHDRSRLRIVCGRAKRPSQVSKHSKPARRRTTMTTGVSPDPGTVAATGAGPGWPPRTCFRLHNTASLQTDNPGSRAAAVRDP